MWVCDGYHPQASDIIKAFELVDDVKSSVKEARENDYDAVYKKALQMSDIRGSESDGLQMPHTCGRQTQQSNVPADNTHQYFRRAILYPFVDSPSQQLELRLNTVTEQALRVLYLLPGNIHELINDNIDALFMF